MRVPFELTVRVPETHAEGAVKMTLRVLARFR